MLKEFILRLIKWLQAQPEYADPPAAPAPPPAPAPAPPKEEPMTTIKAPDCTPVVSNPGPLTAACAAATNIVTGGFTANGVVGGTIPAGAKMQLRVSLDPANGPWQASPQVAASAGNFSYSFTGLTAGQYTIRVDVVDSTGTTALLTSSPDCTATVQGATSLPCSNASKTIATVGDSLTAGSGPGGAFWSWRGQTQSVLTGAGFVYDMTGPNNHNSSGQGPDGNTYASGGQLISGGGNSAVNQLASVPASTTTIVINIGTNGQSASSASEWQAMFATAKSAHPNSDFVLCTLTSDAGISGQINTAIRNIVSTDTSGRVKLADLAALNMTNASGDLSDGTHYTQQGATKVGNAIAAAIRTTSCFGGIVSGGTVAKTYQAEALDANTICSDVVPSNLCQGGWGIAAPAVPNCPTNRAGNLSLILPGGQAPLQVMGGANNNNFASWFWIQTEYKAGAVVVNPPGYRVQLYAPQAAFKIDSLANNWLYPSLAGLSVFPQDISSWGNGPGGALGFDPPFSGQGTNEGILADCLDVGPGNYRNNLAFAGNPRNEVQGISLQVGHTAPLLQYEQNFSGSLPAVGDRIVATVHLGWARLIPETPGGVIPAGVSISATMGTDSYGPDGQRSPGYGRQTKITAAWTPVMFTAVRSGDSSTGTILTGTALRNWLAANMPTFVVPT